MVLSPVERMDIRDALYAHAVKIDEEAAALPPRLKRRRVLTSNWATRLRRLAEKFME